MSIKYDIRRMKQETDTTIGGVSITSTAIETRDIELQTVNGADILRLGGLRIEANYKGFCHKDSNIQETDTITPNSGVTKYEVTSVEDLFDEHLQFFAKKVE